MWILGLKGLSFLLSTLHNDNIILKSPGHQLCIWHKS